MNNEVMPERITVHRINNGETFPDNVSVTEVKPGLLLPGGVEEQEYIRADLAAGDSKKPLAEGQWRWGKKYYNDEWEVWEVELICDKIKLARPHAVLAHLPESFYEIGPVIQPPGM